MNAIVNTLPLLQATGGPASMAPTLVTFGLVFLIFYFLIIRPQNKKQKETKLMLEALQKGDKVVTIGGIRGVINSLKDDSVVIKVDSGTTIEFNRTAVSSVLKKSSGGKGKGKASETESEEDESDQEDT
jgi:preprotein translocase subunit YajC